MSKAPDNPKVSNLNDLLAIAYQIEIDAVERYNLLADQMETHNNPELVKVFRDLARAEGIHGEEIRRLAGDFDVVSHARQIAKFGRSDSRRGRTCICALHDDALARPSALTRRRETRSGLFHLHFGDGERSKGQGNGCRARRGRGRARQSGKPTVDPVSGAERFVGGRYGSACIPGMT